MAVTLSLFAGAGAQFFDNNGVMLSGGLVYTYGAGTTTPLAAYTSNTGATALSNPIVLDASGRVPTGEIWLTYGQGYKFTVKTSTGTLIGTYDNIPSAALPPLVNDAASIAYEQGASITAGNFIIGQTYLITFIGSTNFQSVGAVSNTVGIYFTATGVGSGTGTAELTRTVESRLRDSVSVKDFGAIGDGVTDDTTAIQTAFNESQNKIVYFPAGTYIVSQTIYLGKNGSIAGEGPTATIIKLTHSGVGLYSKDAGVQTTYTRNQIYKDFSITGNVNTTVAFWITFALYCNFTNIDIKIPQSTGAGFTAFRVAGNTYLNTFINCISDTIEESGASHGGRGWWIGNGENDYGSIFAATQENTWITCRGQRANIGWDIDAANGCTLITCGGETCTTAGMRVKGSYNNITNPWLENGALIFDPVVQGNGSGGFLPPAPPSYNTVLPGRPINLTINSGRQTAILNGRLDNVLIGAGADYTQLIRVEILGGITNNGTYGNLEYVFGGQQIYSLQYGSTEEYRQVISNSNVKTDLINGQYFNSNAFLPLELSSPRGFAFTGTNPYMQISSVPSAPGVSPAGTARLYIEDNGAGKLRLMAAFPTGVPQQIAIQP